MTDTLTPADMGMKHGRSGQPNAQWNLLRDFAEEHGTLTWESSRADRKQQKRKEILARRLREFFGISGDPFECVKTGGGWKTRFIIEPD